jgi:hypothetical protein
MLTEFNSALLAACPGITTSTLSVGRVSVVITKRAGSTYSRKQQADS